MSIAAWAAPRARSSLERLSYEAAPLGPRGVEIGISHRGICHSDLHLINKDWGSSRYPAVQGVAANQARYRMVQVNPA